MAITNYVRGQAVFKGSVRNSEGVDFSTGGGGGDLPTSTGANKVLFDDGATQAWSDSPVVKQVTLQAGLVEGVFGALMPGLVLKTTNLTAAMQTTPEDTPTTIFQMTKSGGDPPHL